KLTPQTNFRMASVSKQFTAMAILLLEKQGKLSFDDPLTRFFPDFAPIGARITVGQLLTHSSGIWAYESVMDDNLTEQLSDADVLNLIKGIDNTYFEPGTAFRYSNSAYCLLALIVERVSGQPFPAYLKKHIFRPLGMKNTLVYEAGKRIRNRAYGYARDDQGNLFFSDQSPTSATKGDGGMYTSLEDYMKWHLALQTNRLINLEKALDKVNAPLPGNNGRYGAGWFFKKEGDLEMFHSGSTCGFSNMVIRIPDTGVMVAFFSNIAGNHEAFYPIFDRLRKAGILRSDIRAWHAATD
nr:serine hydrolase domain-containing protein [Flavilitoribacter sp.]